MRITDIRIVWQNDNYVIYEPKTFEEVSVFNYNVNWAFCKSKEEWDKWILSHKHIYIIVNKLTGDSEPHISGKKYYYIIDKNTLKDNYNELDANEFFEEHKDIYNAFKAEKYDVLYSSELVSVRRMKLYDPVKIFVVFLNVSGKELVYISGNRGMSSILKTYAKEHLYLIDPIKQYFNEELLKELYG